MKIAFKERKTNFLTPSALRCLAGLPTVNISAGCAHKCVYCYTKGYSVYPGDDVVELYENMVNRISDEISRKRSKPKAVYFSPSCDPFQPVQDIQQISFEIMKMLLDKGIGVQFVTKGRIDDQTLQLFEQKSSLVCGQIGITTVDDNVRQIVEPHTATVHDKLTQLKRLNDANVKMTMRCDPLIHGLTDSEQQIDDLFTVAAQTGCREIAISFLFLRPAITKSLKQNITDKALLDTILKPYERSIQLPIGVKNSIGTMLPTEVRKTIFARIQKIADARNLNIHICGCKNSDITNENCRITRPTDQSHEILF
ncbi:MAG TPA: radical SAM protein [Phycisphaerales bacterium]|nr:radical SAM protein [Phycisphaerales bacterium]